MTLTLGGLGFWALADAFFITKSLEAKNTQLEMGILDKVKRLRQSST